MGEGHRAMTRPMPSPARNAAIPLACLCAGILIGAHDSIHLERLLRALASAYTLHGAAVAMGVAAVRYWRLGNLIGDRQFGVGYNLGLQHGRPDPCVQSDGAYRMGFDAGLRAAPHLDTLDYPEPKDTK